MLEESGWRERVPTNWHEEDTTPTTVRLNLLTAYCCGGEIKREGNKERKKKRIALKYIHYTTLLPDITSLQVHRRGHGGPIQQVQDRLRESPLSLSLAPVANGSLTDST